MRNLFEETQDIEGEHTKEEVETAYNHFLYLCEQMHKKVPEAMKSVLFGFFEAGYLMALNREATLLIDKQLLDEKVASFKAKYPHLFNTLNK